MRQYKKLCFRCSNFTKILFGMMWNLILRPSEFTGHRSMDSTVDSATVCGHENKPRLVFVVIAGHLAVRGLK